MKTRFLFTSLVATTLLVFSATSVVAASWRVNSNVKMAAHFTDLNAAMKSADVQAGDTLYLDPGCLLSSTQDVTKQVTIIGTGYQLNANVHQEAKITGTLNLRAEGCKIESTNISGTTYVLASNITIERCQTSNILYYNGQVHYVTIRQCYIPNGWIQGAGSGAEASTNTSFWTIENCIIIFTDGYDPVKWLYSPTIRNNYVLANYNSGSAAVAYMTGATVINNILFNVKFIANGEPYTLSNSIVTNNLMHAERMKSTYPNNVYISTNTEEAVFALNGTGDQRYTLKDDSPARGAATDGGDIGPTGGLYPYVPSGYPFGMPHFESSSIATRAQDGKLIVNQQVSIQNQ